MPATYRQHLDRLNDDGGVNRFRLGPEAVYRQARARIGIAAAAARTIP